MKKIIIVLGLIITSSLASFAQSPGGVVGSTVWAKVENNIIPTQIVFKDYSANLKPITPIALVNSFFNYNHSKSFNGNNSKFDFLSKIETLPNATVFVVNKPNTTQSPPTEMALISTTQSIATNNNYQLFQLSTDKYVRPFPVPTPSLVPYNVNYPASSFVGSTYQRPNARINTLVWHNYNKPTIFNSFGVSGESTVSVGEAFGTTNAFNGDIAEVIMYPEALNDNQRLRVESYLGIKYGITLQPDVDYLSSKSSKVWHKENNGFFKNRIIGLGRDSNTSLYQRQSTSSHDLTNQLILSRSNSILPNNYPFSNTSNNITDQNYILVGDNDKTQTIDSEVINGITTIKRKWLVQNTGEEAHLFNTSLHYKPNPAITLGSNEAFWLIVDRNASNTTESNFSGTNIEYYPFITTPNTTFPNGGYASYTNLKWGSDTQHFNQFTFGIGPRMLILTKVNEMQCDETEGIVNIAIKGGQPGFTINVHGTDNPFNLQLNQPGFNLELSLNVGNYQVTVTDATGFSQSENFIISPTFNINIQLEDIYNLYNLPETVIDATTFVVEPFENYQFEWIHNGNIISTEPTILVNNLNVGTYILQITNKLGCKVSKQFVVIKDEFYRDIKVLVYPNPSDGNFTVFLNLLDIKDINIEISDVLGKIIFNETFTGKKTYENQYNINASGIYFIRITSKEFSTTHKIIIN